MKLLIFTLKFVIPLFWLSYVVRGMEIDGVLDALWGPILRHRKFALIFFSTAALSALFTNDVGLFLVLPVALRGSRRPALAAFALSLAANAGSAFMPWANPQNLMIYRGYSLNFWHFLSFSLPLGTIGLVLVSPFAFLKLSPEPIKLSSHKRAPFWLLAFGLLVTLITVHAPWWLMSLFLLPFLITRVSVLARIPWWFLILIGFSVAGAEVLAPLLSLSPKLGPETAALGFALSQLVSNVPATALLLPHCSSFPSWLFLGVNAGGLGTPWASVANLIALAHLPKGYRLKGSLFLLTGLPLGALWVLLGAWR